MTHDERAKWIGRVLFVVLIVGVIAYVYAPKGTQAADGKAKAAETRPQTESEEAKEPDVINFDHSASLKPGKIQELLDEASRKRGGPVVGIIHAHAPGNKESEEIADILNRVAKKYGAQVLVIRVNVIACPEFAKEQHITRPPEVMMVVRNVVEFKFQGLWTQAKIEKKIDELLFGLQRYGKGWRPDVKGMKPAGAN